MTAAPLYDEDKTGLGVELRDARLGRGLSLDECQSATRISRRYLEALEDEDFEALPAPVFARGFLRSYAQYLGLDPTTLVERFPGEPRPPDTLRDVGVLGQPPRQPRRRGAPRSGAGPRYEDERYYDEESLSPIPTIDTETPSVRLGPWLVAAFVVLVVLAGVIAVVALGDEDAPAATPLAAPPGVVAGPADTEADAEAVPTEPTIRLETMPDLSVRTISDATVILRRSGLPFVIFEVYDEVAPVGAVLDQAPPPGTQLETGASVTLLVSRGPVPTAPVAPPPLDDTAGAGTPAGGTPGDDATAGEGPAQ